MPYHFDFCESYINTLTLLMGVTEIPFTKPRKYLISMAFSYPFRTFDIYMIIMNLLFAITIFKCFIKLISLSFWIFFSTFTLFFFGIMAQESTTLPDERPKLFFFYSEYSQSYAIITFCFAFKLDAARVNS